MKKQTGSFYTPKKLTNFMVGYLNRKIKDREISILEPSAGDGVFIDSLIRHWSFDRASIINLTVVDTNSSELDKTKKVIESTSHFNHVTAIAEDFLAIPDSAIGPFSLIIGNPPYISKKSLSDSTIERCRESHKAADLNGKTINNIWTSFVVSCTRRLTEDGIMELVLPSDLLQVKYAEEIRIYLEESFERIEIFSLGVDAFPDIEQQTILLFAYKSSPEPGTFFFKITDYDSNEVEMLSSNGLMICQSKWTHYNLSTSEINLLNSIRQKLPIISDFVDVSAGIVTGANKYFILSEQATKEVGANSYLLPVLSKSSFVTKGLDFSELDFSELSKNSKPAFLLDLNNKCRNNKKLDNYLEEGRKEKINERYKCSLREDWFKIPNIGTPPEAIFFKRIHKQPKVIRNDSGVYVTDTAYRINSKKGIEIKSFVRSFYNIITLIYAELMGRKYGGGVLELTPNEFKNLPIHYRKISREDYDKVSRSITFNDSDRKWICSSNLKLDLGISDEQIASLENIYDRLVSSRVF